MSALKAARVVVDRGLWSARTVLDGFDLRITLDAGQAIRPLVAYAAARALGHARDDRFWRAALAVQLAHEASLVHDDVIDGANERRGRPTLQAHSGIGAAIAHGDHLLTAGYRLAAASANPAWFAAYAEALERTVAGELRQGRVRGRVLARADYRAVVRGKSGELLGLALAQSALLAGDARAHTLRELGRDLGVLYQMLDDLLDYCPGSARGKPALRDHAQRQWTWVLDEVGPQALDLPAAELVARLHERTTDGTTPARRALATLGAEADALRARHRALLADDAIVPALLDGWLAQARAAIATEETLRAARQVERDDLVFARNSRSFRFAATFFPARLRGQVAAVYAFCRFTDDLVDESDDAPAIIHERLDAWRTMVRAVWAGEPSGIGFLDRSVGVMARHRVPLEYAEWLIAGVRMDLDAPGFASLNELRGYTFRVAGVVGLWLTRLFGVHDTWTLQQAAALGHAMQVTNILRDVGADLRRGRVYLPAATLAEFDLGVADLQAMADGAPIDARWIALVEHLIGHAEDSYARAGEGVARLPRRVRAPVAIAARVYAGIHDAIRANGYDTFTRRAATTGLAKARLAAAAVVGIEARSPLRARPAVTTGLAALALCAVPLQAQSPRGAATRDTAALQAIEHPSLETVRELYFTAVEDETAIAIALTHIAAHRATGGTSAALLDAYVGAFDLLRAKHASWPGSKLRHARAGLRRLDAAVRADPAHAEIRYLRLVSTVHLPGFFDRDATVRQDTGHLVTAVTSAAGIVPRRLQTVVLALLVDHAPLASEQRTALRAVEGHGS